MAIGYWLLGTIVEQVTKQRYSDYVRCNILQPLRLSVQDSDFAIPMQLVTPMVTWPSIHR